MILHIDCSCKFVVRFSCQIFSKVTDVVNTSARLHTSAMGAKSANATNIVTTFRGRMLANSGVTTANVAFSVLEELHTRLAVARGWDAEAANGRRPQTN